MVEKCSRDKIARQGALHIAAVDSFCETINEGEGLPCKGRRGFRAGGNGEFIAANLNLVFDMTL